MGLIEKLKSNKQLKEFVLYLIVPKRNPRPRWWVRVFLNRFFHKRGKGALVRWNNRMDVFPWNKFEMGDESTIESYCTINNGAGDIIIGDRVRIGIGSVVTGPTHIGTGTALGQHVSVSGFNHGFKDGNKNSREQSLDIRPTIIEEDALIGTNAVIVAGITIGKRCQIGAGSVVTKDIPPYTVAVGNPAKVIKIFNQDTEQWESYSKSSV